MTDSSTGAPLTIDGHCITLTLDRNETEGVDAVDAGSADRWDVLGRLYISVIM